MTDINKIPKSLDIMYVKKTTLPIDNLASLEVAAGWLRSTH